MPESHSAMGAATPRKGLRDLIAAELVQHYTMGLCQLDGPCEACDCFDPRHEVMRAEADKIIGIVRQWITEWLSQPTSAGPEESSPFPGGKSPALDPLPKLSPSGSPESSSRRSTSARSMLRSWTRWGF